MGTSTQDWIWGFFEKWEGWLALPPISAGQWSAEGAVAALRRVLCCWPQALTGRWEDRCVKGCEALGVARGPREPHRNLTVSVPIASMILSLASGGGEGGAGGTGR